MTGAHVGATFVPAGSAGPERREGGPSPRGSPPLQPVESLSTGAAAPSGGGGDRRCIRRGRGVEPVRRGRPAPDPPNPNRRPHRASRAQPPPPPPTPEGDGQGRDSAIARRVPRGVRAARRWRQSSESIRRRRRIRERAQVAFDTTSPCSARLTGPPEFVAAGSRRSAPPRSRPVSCRNRCTKAPVRRSQKHGCDDASRSTPRRDWIIVATSLPRSTTQVSRSVRALDRHGTWMDGSSDPLRRSAHLGAALARRRTVRRPAAPLKLNFCLTYWCQYRCKTCNIWQRKPTDELTTDEVRRLRPRESRTSRGRTSPAARSSCGRTSTRSSTRS